MSGRSNVKAMPSVAVIGGTHGNELAGVWLIHSMIKSPTSFQRPGLAVEPMLGNPRAVSAGTRFVDCDLNRCFTADILGRSNPTSSTEISATNPRAVLNAPESSQPERAGDACSTLNCRSVGIDKERKTATHYEEARAQELAARLSKADICIDFHNTTANVGCMIIISDESDPLALHLAAALVRANPRRRIWLPCPPGGKSDRKLANVGSAAHCDIGIEIGPQPHGYCRFEVFEEAKQILQELLDVIHAFLVKRESMPACELELFRWTGELVKFPTDDTGTQSALIHPALQDADFMPLCPGTPVFKNIADDSVTTWSREEVYPVFIGEVAYCAPPPLGNAAGVAFMPCIKESIMVPSFQMGPEAVSS